MRINPGTTFAGLLIGVALLSLGCASAPRGADSGGATTPQQKAHQAQLAEMSREDADDARTPGHKKRPAGPSPRTRRTGQRVIDQPTRP
jgi:hypothetical protein